MKSNVIFRIVLWSLVIILLVGLLLWGMTGFKQHSRWHMEDPAETMVPIRVDADSGVDPEPVYTVLEPLNIRSQPNPDSSPEGMLEKGDIVYPTRIEEISGKRWGYIAAPEKGWVDMEYIETSSGQLDTLETHGPGSGYGRQAQGLKEINIEWALGNITIQSEDVERIEVREVNRNDEKVGNMVINNSGSKLSIRYSEKASWNLGISVTDTMAKDLYVAIPLGFSLDTLEVDTASATLKVENMTIQEVDFDGASGTCDFVNCDINSMNLDTASGDITFRGKLEELDCDAASASIYAVFENVPNRIDMDSMSGDLDITLPQTAGFTVTMDGMRCDFRSDFSYSIRSDSYYCGDGACKISVDAMSGDVYVWKLVETAVREEAVTASSPAYTCQEHGEDCPDPYHCQETEAYCQEHGADCNDPAHISNPKEKTFPKGEGGSPEG